MFKLLKILLYPSVLIYSILIRTRNSFFDRGIFKSHSVNAKVISIGNLTFGGSGKTPMVIYVTNLLKSAGIKVGILSRGYRRETKGYLLVSDGEKIKVDVDKCGDEMYLMASECKVPAAVCEKRVEGANKLLNDINLDAIILDDAFQHRWIDRDLNILIFDQRFLSRFKNIDQHLLPTGIMREPYKAVERADLIIINRKFSEKVELHKKLNKYFKNKRIYFAHYKAEGIYDVKNHKFYRLSEFHGQKSLVVSGIAKPYSFLNILEKNNIDISNKLLFPDHKNYTQKEVQQIRKAFYETNSFSVLTTQKDAVKLIKYSKEFDDIDIYYLKIEIQFEDETNFNNQILKIFK